MKRLDRIRGCLLGGTAGDALGYAVEFCSEEEMFSRYGEKGITEYRLTDGLGRISDDTQMTAYTANGLLLAATKAAREGGQPDYVKEIGACYVDWLKGQVRGVRNEQGDSDSTGAVTGNILGAKLGAKKIPYKYLDALEGNEILEVLANDLYVGEN